MSVYAYDRARGVVTVSWYTAERTHLCHDLAGVHGLTAPQVELVSGQLCGTLSRLVEGLWEAGDLAAESLPDLWTAGTPVDVATVLESAISQLERPTASGPDRDRDVPTDWLARAVGEVLAHLPSQWGGLVLDDLKDEFDAIVRAGDGWYDGRAEQAVWRDRLTDDAHEVNLALDALSEHDNPFHAVANVPAQAGGLNAVAAAAVVLAAAARSHQPDACGMFGWMFDHEHTVADSTTRALCSDIVDLPFDGVSPADGAVSAVRVAVAAGRGRIHDPDAMYRTMTSLDRIEVDVLRTRMLSRVARLTPFRTVRVAEDVFERLLDGIWLVVASFLRSAEPAPDLVPDGDRDGDDAVTVELHRSLVQHTRLALDELRPLVR